MARVCVVMILLSALVPSGQVPPGTASYTIPFWVEEGNGRVSRDVPRPGDIELRVAGKVVPIASVTRQAEPVSVILAVDMSASATVGVSRLAFMRGDVWSVGDPDLLQGVDRKFVRQLPAGYRACTLEEVVNAVLKVQHAQSIQCMLKRLADDGWEVLKRTADAPTNG